MGRDATYPAWTPKGRSPDFLDYRDRYSNRDVYFDLEFIRQTRAQGGAFEDDDWQLITAIPAVVEGGDGKPVSLYGHCEVEQPGVATEREGEKRVIRAFLDALERFLGLLEASRPAPDSSGGESEARNGGEPEEGLPAPALRLFNYSGSGVEGRLWSKLDRRRPEIEGHDPEKWETLLRSISKKDGEDPASPVSYGDGIERFDLQRVVKSLYEAFPLDRESKHGLKVVEKFIPSFSRPGNLVGSEDSMATWMRIRMLHDEIGMLTRELEEAGVEASGESDGDDPGKGCDIDPLDENEAKKLRRRRLERELRRLEDSYLTYAEWDCRALYYLHRHLIALHYAAGPEPNAVILGRRPTLARYGLFLSDAGTSGGGADPTMGRRATSARHGLVVGKSDTDQSAR